MLLSMKNSFLYALVDLLMPNYPTIGINQKKLILHDIYPFISSSLEHAPVHIRFGEKVLRFSLRAWLTLARISLPTSHPLYALAAIKKFENLSPTTRGLLRLYRSLITLAFFEHPFIIEALQTKPSTTTYK